MVMTKTDAKTLEMVSVTDPHRRRWSVTEKAALVRQTYDGGVRVLFAVRQQSVAATQLFNWCKHDRDGALTAVSAGESVVHAGKWAAARAQISQSRQLLSKKTIENKVLTQAMDIARK